MIEGEKERRVKKKKKKINPLESLKIITIIISFSILPFITSRNTKFLTVLAQNNVTSLSVFD